MFRFCVKLRLIKSSGHSGESKPTFPPRLWKKKNIFLLRCLPALHDCLAMLGLRMMALPADLRASMSDFIKCTESLPLSGRNVHLHCLLLPRGKRLLSRVLMGKMDYRCLQGRKQKWASRVNTYNWSYAAFASHGTTEKENDKVFRSLYDIVLRPW